MKMRLFLKKFGGKWWIMGRDGEGPWGPYDNRKEANEDRQGIVRTMLNEDVPGYATVDRPEEIEERKARHRKC